MRVTSAAFRLFLAISLSATQQTPNAEAFRNRVPFIGFLTQQSAQHQRQRQTSSGTKDSLILHNNNNDGDFFFGDLMKGFGWESSPESRSSLGIEEENEPHPPKEAPPLDELKKAAVISSQQQELVRRNLLEARLALEHKARKAAGTDDEVEEEVDPIDVSIPYDAAARLAYEAAGSPGGDYEAFKTKYEEDAIADVIAKNAEEEEEEEPIDVSIPYDAAAKLAYEAAGSPGGDYEAYKSKYEQDAIADVITKNAPPEPEEEETDTDDQLQLQQQQQEQARIASEAAEKATAEVAKATKAVVTKVVDPIIGPEIEKGVPFSTIQSASIGCSLLAWMMSKGDVTVVAGTYVSVAIMSITPGPIGETLRTLGGLFSDTLYRFSSLSNKLGVTDAVSDKFARMEYGSKVTRLKNVEQDLQLALEQAETNLAVIEADEMDLEKAETIQASVAQVLREADAAIANALQIQEDKIRLAEEELQDLGWEGKAKQADETLAELVQEANRLAREAEDLAADVVVKKLEKESEQARITEEQRLALEARIAEEERIAAEKREEEIRQTKELEARIAEEERIAAEKREEEVRLTKELEARIAEEERIAAEKREEEIRLTKELEARIAEEERIAAEKREEEIRLTKELEARIAEEERIAAEQREEEIRQTEALQARIEEEERIAAEKREEEIRLTKELEARIAEEERLAAEARKLEEERVAAEEERLAEEQRLADEAEAARLASVDDDEVTFVDDGEDWEATLDMAKDNVDGIIVGIEDAETDESEKADWDAAGKLAQSLGGTQSEDAAVFDDEEPEDMGMEMDMEELARAAREAVEKYEQNLDDSATPEAEDDDDDGDDSLIMFDDDLAAAARAAVEAFEKGDTPQEEEEEEEEEDFLTMFDDDTGDVDINEDLAAAARAAVEAYENGDAEETEEDDEGEEGEDFLSMFDDDDSGEVSVDDLAAAARAAVEAYENGGLDDDGGMLFDDEVEEPAVSPPTPEPPTTDWSKLKVAELRAELKGRGLPTAGKKAELVAKLEEYDRDLSARMATSESSASAPTATGEIDFSDMDLEEISRAAREAAELFDGEEPSDEVLMMLENEAMTFDDVDVGGGDSDNGEAAASEADYASMTVNELKDELRSRGLKVSGKKADLIERLRTGQ